MLCKTLIGREQVVAENSLQPTVLHHTAENSPQRMTPLLSSRNQFTLPTPQQEESNINGQNAASSDMQQVLIQVG